MGIELGQAQACYWGFSAAARVSHFPYLPRNRPCSACRLLCVAKWTLRQGKTWRKKKKKKSMNICWSSLISRPPPPTSGKVICITTFVCQSHILFCVRQRRPFPRDMGMDLSLKIRVSTGADDWVRFEARKKRQNLASTNPFSWENHRHWTHSL